MTVDPRGGRPMTDFQKYSESSEFKGHFCTCGHTYVPLRRREYMEPDLDSLKRSINKHVLYSVFSELNLLKED